MGQFDAASGKQMDILPEKTLEARGREVEDSNHRNATVYYPQSFQEFVDSDSEEPEMDPEEEPEEDPEEELEEDPEEEPEEYPKEAQEEPEEPDEGLEMDGKLCYQKVGVECATPLKLSTDIVSAEQLTEHKDEDPSAECVFEPNSESATDKVYQNLSDGKQRMVVNAAVRSSLTQNYCLEKNWKYDEFCKQEFKIMYAASNQHHVPGEHEEAVVGNDYSVRQANTGKRRCSKWEPGPEEDKKAVIEDRKCKKGKTVCDANDSKSTLQEPLQLTDLCSSLCGPLLDLDIQSLKKRLSRISSILGPLVDGKHEIGVYAADKLIEEREKIFLELAKRNAIISKELYVPVKEYPTYNFIGLILGPKGNTQKKMELKSGARIRLRGKDSSKSTQEADPSDDEDLNVYIEAISQESLDAAVCMVKKLLISVEDEMNDHKRAHLQELFNHKEASLFSSCSVCKDPGHDQLVCPLKKAILKAACDTCESFSRPGFGCPVTPSNLKIKSSREIDAANLFIRYLPQTIDDSRLRELFSPFGTIIQLRVLLDMRTGYSKGCGLVRFDTPAAASLAMMHMNGYEIEGHRLTVRIAGDPPATGQPATSLLPNNPNPGPATGATSCSILPSGMLPEAQMSVLNGKGLYYPSSQHMEYSTNLYVGFLPQTIDDSCLWQLFSPFGTVIQARVILDMKTGYSKGYGFVSFDNPSAASLAIMHMNGYEIDGHRLAVRLRTAGTAPPTRPQTSNLLPVYSIPQHAVIATSCPALPPYMMPIFSQNMESKNQNAPVIAHEVSGSAGSSAAHSSTAFVLQSTESATASPSAESRTTLSLTGLAATSTEPRSVISSYSFSSLFFNNPS